MELAPPFVLMLCLEWIVVSMLRMLNMIHKQNLPIGFEERELADVGSVGGVTLSAITEIQFSTVHWLCVAAGKRGKIMHRIINHIYQE